MPSLNLRIPRLWSEWVFKDRHERLHSPGGLLCTLWASLYMLSHPDVLSFPPGSHIHYWNNFQPLQTVPRYPRWHKGGASKDWFSVFPCSATLLSPQKTVVEKHIACGLTMSLSFRERERERKHHMINDAYSVWLSGAEKASQWG